MKEEDPSPLLTLIQAGGSAASRRGLLDAHESPTRALAAGASAWRAAGLSEAQIQRLRQPDREEMRRAVAWLDQPGRHLLGWHDPDYPPLLLRISSPPLALFVDGDPALLWHAGDAAEGSR